MGNYDQQGRPFGDIGVVWVETLMSTIFRDVTSQRESYCWLSRLRNYPSELKLVMECPGSEHFTETHIGYESRGNSPEKVLGSELPASMTNGPLGD